MVLGSGVGWLLNCVFRFRRRIVEMQLRIAFPELDDRAFCELRNRVYQHLGRMLVEILSFPCMPPEHVLKHVEWHGRENIDAALAKGKGLCLLCGHLGNWEVPALAFAALGYDFRAIGKEMKSKAGETFRVMLRGGVVTIPRRGSIRDILRGLKSDGSIVAFMIDQNMTSSEGEFVDFFGQPACSMTNLAVIAPRTGAPVVAGCTWRDDKGVHHCKFFPELPLPPDASPQELTQHFARTLEDLIREHPEQWLWIHKRWRTRPDDEVDSPFDYRRKR